MKSPVCCNDADEVLYLQDLKAWADACTNATAHCEGDQARLLFDIVGSLLFARERRLAMSNSPTASPHGS